jgi:hypothetical protein
MQDEEKLYGLKQAPRQWYMKFESIMGSKATRDVAQTIMCLFRGSQIMIISFYCSMLMIS